MKAKKLFATLTIISVVLIGGCKKKDNTSSSTGTLMVIPVQTTVQTMVPLSGAVNFAVLAGSTVTNTGNTTVTGDLGLSPGTQVSGFGPGVLIGTQHIN